MRENAFPEVPLLVLVLAIIDASLVWLLLPPRRQERQQQQHVRGIVQLQTSKMMMDAKTMGVPTQ
jgi:hypothetical protein